MDLCPTLAKLGGSEMPEDQIIDGKDISALMTSEGGAASPNDTFFYYRLHNLMAVRSGKWKLHAYSFSPPDRQIVAINELYDLETDIGETNNLAKKFPEKVAELKELMLKIEKVN